MQDRDTKRLWKYYITEMEGPPQAVGASSYASQQGAEAPPVSPAQMMPDGEEEERIQTKEAQKEKKARLLKNFKNVLKSWGLNRTGRRT